MNELSLWSWLLFDGEFTGHLLYGAFALAQEEANLVTVLDRISEALGLDDED